MAKPGKLQAPRRAITYQTVTGAHRHQFKQDGDVLVVRISLAQGPRVTEQRAHCYARQIGRDRYSGRRLLGCVKPWT